MRARTRQSRSAELAPIEVFGVDQAGALVAPAHGDLTLDPVKRWLDVHPDTPVDRPGMGPAPRAFSRRARSRAGAREEVFLPTAADPAIALRRALDGRLFERPTRWMTVDTSSPRVLGEGWGAAWDARVSIPLTRCSRSATLRMYASPSGSLTLLQLLPRHTHGLGAGSFVFAGVRAARALSAQLEADPHEDAARA